MARRVVVPLAALLLSVVVVPPAVAEADPVASAYTPVTPVRVLDTRTGGGIVGAGQSVVLDLSSRTPADATAVVLNVTATEPTSNTYVTVWPADGTRPTASNLNLVPGETRPNLVTVKLGPTRRVNLFNAAGTVHLLADLSGYYATNAVSRYQPLPAARVLDTRAGTGVGTPNADGSLPLDLTGVIPAEASAVTFNLTATNVTADTYVTAWPHGEPRPTASNLNLVPGDTRANLVTVALGDDRTVDLYTRQGTVDLIADLAGFYVPGEGLGFYPVDPVRVGDTRSSAPARPDDPKSLWLGWTGSVPDDATAVLLNVTATEASTATYVSAGPGGAGPARSSTLNVTPAATVPNLAAVMLGMTGVVVLRPGAGSVHLVVDMAGYFAPVPTTCASGCVYAWGQNNDGMLGSGGGTGSNAYYGDNTPRLVSGLDGVRAVAGRYALRADGTVWAWGANDFGALGAGWHVDGGFAPVPVRVRGLTDVTAIASAWSTGYALRADGTVWGWGMNYSDELGPGTSPERLSDVPVRIEGVDDVVAIAASSGTAYAVRSDRTVWSWGSNSSGELGVGTTGAGSSTPVRVVGLTDVTEFVAGGDTRYALRADGTVWTWGGNAEGQLGNGTSSGQTGTPTPVPGLGGVVSVAASSRTGYAVQTDRTVVAWGAHTHGEAGVGGAGRDVRKPTPVVGLTRVAEVVGAGGNGYAVLDDGSVWGWGVNVWYQLGDRDGGTVFTPQRIPGLPPGGGGGAAPPPPPPPPPKGKQNKKKKKTKTKK
ncbi:hypothetical protein AB0I91_27540, partial [Actinosynnema sp. NPDC049800]